MNSSEQPYEMLWDCDHCDTKGLLGKSQRHCPECGAKQNPDKRYFPEEGKEQRVDGHKYEGADRQCPSCNAAISANAKNCTNCGTPQDGWKEVKGVEIPKVVKAPRRIWLIVLVIALAVAVLIVGIWLLFFRTKSAELTVTAHRWERASSTSSSKPRRTAGAPTARRATPTTCATRRDFDEQVKSGEKCDTVSVDNKDGTFRRRSRLQGHVQTVTAQKDTKFSVRRWNRRQAKWAPGQAQWPSGIGRRHQASLDQRREPHREALLPSQGGDSCDVSGLWTKIKGGTKLTVTMKARSTSTDQGPLKQRATLGHDAPAGASTYASTAFTETTDQINYRRPDVRDVRRDDRARSRDRTAHRSRAGRPSGRPRASGRSPRADRTADRTTYLTYVVAARSRVDRTTLTPS
jgi:hypothetical protein